MCIWKSWKKVKTRVSNLKKCDALDWQAYQWGNTRLGCWRVVNSRLLSSAMSNDKLRRAGYVGLMDCYLEWYPKEEPPYAERHVRWWERSENESRKKTTSFSSYSIFYSNGE